MYIFSKHRMRRPSGIKACQFSVTVMLNELKCGKNPFWQDNALFASKAKINVFLKKISSLQASLWKPSTRKNFQKTLILAFEANSALSCQNGFFPHFSSLCDIWRTTYLASEWRHATQQEVCNNTHGPKI